MPEVGRPAQPPPEIAAAQRLLKNKGGYFGDTIDLPKVQEHCLESARRHGWSVDAIEAGPGLTLFALRRPVSNAKKNIYISTGIHGDEPAGPLALRQLLHENQWPRETGLWLCPCLNPTGFPLNRRENAGGRDLNRDYRHLQTTEVSAHIRWLERQPGFDLTLCLHEDWESHGFYLYELNPENRPSLAERIIEEVAKVCPIDLSELIEDRPAKNGIICPSLDPNSRPQWPEAFYLIQNKTRHSYTLEAPSDFPLPMRVAALVTATRTALREVQG